MYADQDTRAVLKGIGGFHCSEPTSYDDVLSRNTKRTAGTPWLRRQAVLADANDDFAALEFYTWSVEFFVGITVTAYRDVYCRISSL